MRSKLKIPHSRLDETTLLEISRKYLYLSDVIRDFKIDREHIKKSFEYYGITYPFSRGQGLPYRRYKFACNEDFFFADTEKSFYWAGMWASDGCIYKPVNKNSYIIQLALATKDRAHLEKFKNDIEYAGTIYDRTVKPGEFLLSNYTYQEYYFVSSLAIRSKKLYDSLVRFGLTDRKTYSYTMPEWLITHPLVNHFIRGYIDGDGTIGIRNDKYGNPAYLHIALLGACPAVKQIYDIISSSCILKTGGSFFHRINEYGTIMNHFEFGSIIDVKHISEYLYQNATVYLDRKFQPTLKIDEFIAQSNLYHFNKEELQTKYKELKTIVALADFYGLTTTQPIRTAFKLYNIPFNTKDEIIYNSQTYYFDKEIFQQQYEQLKSCKKMAELYNCSGWTILSHLRKFNIPIQAKSGNLSSKMIFDKDKLIEQYTQLQCFEKVGKLYNCSGNTIMFAMKDFGIDYMKLKTPPPLFRKYNFDRETLIKQLEEYGTLKAVAKLYKCDPGTIVGAIKKLNINYTPSPTNRSKK